MRTAIYLEDGLLQVVLSPENAHERQCLALLHQHEKQIVVKQGAFYECRAGYVRMNDSPKPEDTMLVIRNAD